jgi:capsular polysaccharide transport system permease protein
MKDTDLTRELFEFGSALRRYGQIIWALLRREEELRRHAPLEAIVGLLEPVALIAVFCLVWIIENRHTPIGGSPWLFFTTGLYAKYYFVYIGQRMGRTRRNKRSSAEQWLDHIMVHIIMRFAEYLILGILLFGLLAIFEDPQAFPSSIVPIAASMGYLTMLGFFWGMCMVVLTRGLDVPQFFFSGINRFLILFSGAFFIVDFFPPEFRYVLSFNPMLHAIILFRTGFYPDFPALTLDTTYLAYCSFGAVVFGLVIERASRRLLENR